MRWNDLPGQRFGPYEILEEIGRGGTSRVYRARDHQREREVAFKIMPSDADDHRAFMQRFIRETEIIRQLNHPNIVLVYDAGETEEFVYLAMQLARGMTLRQLAGQRRMSAPEAARYMIQAANALHHAHTQGIIHRDVKPSNMLIPYDNPALLLLSDFGTAKILGARGPTKTGATIGTPEYMSPEQAEGREVDQRSDIYSLGCTLYEALAGRPPFVGATPVSVLYQQVHAQPTYIRSYNSAVPRELWNVLRNCLAKRPEDRYGSAERVAEELIPFAEGLIQPTPAPWRAPTTERLQFDPQDRPTNRTLRAQPQSSYDGGPQATPLPPPYTPAPSPITPGYQPGHPTLGPRTPRTSMAPYSGATPGQLSGGLTPSVGRDPMRASEPLSGAPPPPTWPDSQSGPRSSPGHASYGPRSMPSGPLTSRTGGPRSRVSGGPQVGGVSGQQWTPSSGADWGAAGMPPSYRSPTSGPLRGATSGPMRGATSGPMRGQNSGSLYRSATSGPIRAPNSGHGGRVGVASGPRPGAGRHGARATTPLRSGPSLGTLVAGVVALLLLGAAMALGAAGMGLLPGLAVAAKPTATVAPTATLSPTATMTATPPSTTTTPTAQQRLDRQAAEAFKGLTIASFSDLSCSISNQATSYATGQPVFVNLCIASKSPPGPVTVAVRSHGKVIRTLYYKQYMSANSGYSQGHTLTPGDYDMLITVTINGKPATAKDIPFTVR